MCDLATDSGRLASEVATFETLTWVSVAQSLPDGAMTCMVAVVGQSEPTWLGFLNDDNEWCDVTSGAPFPTPVTHWADMPAGPN